MNTPLNEPLFRQIQHQLRTHPEQYNQGNWGDGNACGTVCCLAGWAALLAHPGARLEYFEVIKDDKNLGTIPNVAHKELGLGERKSETLFMLGGWKNEDLSDQFVEARNQGDQVAQANIACKYLDWYLETQK